MLKLLTDGETRPTEPRTVPKVTCKSGPAQGPCVLSQDSQQGPHETPMGSGGPGSPSKFTRINRSNTGASMRFSPWGHMACPGDAGHLPKAASTKHLVPEDTGRISEAVTLALRWPWCWLTGHLPWVPTEAMGSPSLPTALPAFPRFISVCFLGCQRVRSPTWEGTAICRPMVSQPPPCPLLALSAEESRPHWSLAHRQVPAWRRCTRGF